MSPSIFQLLLVVLAILLLFGAGKLPKVMGDLGKGIKNLKEGLKEDEKGALNKNDDKEQIDNKDSNIK